MTITLPPAISGTASTLDPRQRLITVIGANGAGKSCFTDRMALLNDEVAYRMSALHALYDTTHRDRHPLSVDSLYAKACERSGLLRPDCPSGLERVVGLLIYDELMCSLTYKVAVAECQKPVLRRSKLDLLIAAWKRVFPGNSVLVEGGRLVFGDDNGPRQMLRLSDGERAVLYYIGAVLLAPRDGIIFVDNPSLFLHPTVSHALWDSLEWMRQDCRFVYTTHDVEFASSRAGNALIWVRRFDPAKLEWDYDVMPPHAGIPEDMYLSIIGARNPVLFIEGDDVHSIDAKLYSRVFSDYTVKALGSCNKVIESVRTFNDLQSFHHLSSRGIVDRDRRDDGEVAYLRRKNIMVPEVAEVENILMLEPVICATAEYLHRNPSHVFFKVRKAVLNTFRADMRAQALQHTRHRVKRMAEYKIDGRFQSIDVLENHLRSLVKAVNPRGIYEQLCARFRRLVDDGDYAGVLKVYNQKTMLQQSNLPQLLGLSSREEYVDTVLSILRTDHPSATVIREAIIAIFPSGGSTASDDK